MIIIKQIITWNHKHSKSILTGNRACVHVSAIAIKTNASLLPPTFSVSAWRIALDIDRPREIRCMQVRNPAKKHENVRTENYNAGENNSADANTIFFEKVLLCVQKWI